MIGKVGKIQVAPLWTLWDVHQNQVTNLEVVEGEGVVWLISLPPKLNLMKMLWFKYI